MDVCGRNRQRMPVDLVEAGTAFHTLDRPDGASVGAVLGDGADLLVDCLAFTASDAQILVPFLGSVGSTVMVSSKAVYVDDEGRHVNSESPPRFNGPISESQPTVLAGGGDHNTPEGYGANKVAAEQTLLDSGFPVTIVRASKVHGEGARPAREWVFVKRVLDGRPAVFLRGRGESIDHTTAAVNLAALIELSAEVPGSRVLNSADPDAPTVLEISRIIARHLGHTWEEVLVGYEADPAIGATPWDTVSPILLDMTAATRLGYMPVGSYAQTVIEEVDWLVANSQRGACARQDESYFEGLFNYSDEDQLLATHGAVRP